MSNIKVIRNPKREGDRIKIVSTAEEDLSLNEFKVQYNQHCSELHMLESQLSALREQLDILPKVDDVSDEMKKFKEMLDQANNLVRRDGTIKKMKEIEIKVADKKDELKKFNLLVQQIIKEKQAKKE